MKAGFSGLCGAPGALLVGCTGSVGAADPAPTTEPPRAPFAPVQAAASTRAGGNVVNTALSGVSG